MKEQLEPRKIFEVMIRDSYYDVYDIDGKEHGGYNDTPKTWWIYYSERLPDGAVPPADSEFFKPWNVGILRRCWDIRIKQTNSTKHKWGDIDFRNNTSVEMWCNGKLIYSFGTFGMSFAFAKVQYLQTVLSEHCFNFFEPDKEEGRKIYWYGLPATIKLKHYKWEIGIVPDYTDGLTKEEWWKNYAERKKKLGNRKKSGFTIDDQFEEMEKDELEEDIRDEYINWGDALSDEHIDWFRH